MDMLHAATQVLRQLKDIGQAAAEHALQQQGQAYEAEWRRLQQMQSSALSEDGAKQWVQTFEEAGMVNVQLRPLECALGLVAWNIQARA
jgi:cell division protein FtsL